MGRPKIAIDEAQLFDACQHGTTVSNLLKVFPVSRETMRKAILQYVILGKLAWAKKGAKGSTGILKTVVTS